MVNREKWLEIVRLSSLDLERSNSSETSVEECSHNSSSSSEGRQRCGGSLEKVISEGKNKMHTLKESMINIQKDHEGGNRSHTDERHQYEENDGKEMVKIVRPQMGKLSLEDLLRLLEEMERKLSNQELIIATLNRKLGSSFSKSHPDGSNESHSSPPPLNTCTKKESILDEGFTSLSSITKSLSNLGEEDKGRGQDEILERMNHRLTKLETEIERLADVPQRVETQLHELTTLCQTRLDGFALQLSALSSNQVFSTQFQATSYKSKSPTIYPRYNMAYNYRQKMVQGIKSSENPNFLSQDKITELETAVDKLKKYYISLILKRRKS